MRFTFFVTLCIRLGLASIQCEIQPFDMVGVFSSDLGALLHQTIIPSYNIIDFISVDCQQQQEQ